MEALVIILLIYILVYVAVIGRLVMGQSRVREFFVGSDAAQTTFTIVIPFRNERKNLPVLLESLSKIEYPRTMFEVILIDDESTDNGQSLVYRWRMENGSLHATLLENIRRSGSPKKDAISRAIPIATGDWIITTDADCELPKTWLSALDQFIRSTGSRMVAGPVAYAKAGGWAAQFQRHDLLAMQGATMGGFGLSKPFMCNGANFAYEKKLFHELGGFAGNRNSPGGDDVFLLHKAVASGINVGYLKSRAALVRTQAEKGWASLINQRVRWASKAGDYQNNFAEDIALAVLFGNSALIVLGILAMFNPFALWVFALSFILKLAIDWIVMARANRFLGQGSFVFPVFSAVVYPIFSSVVAVLAARGKYAWKGRKFIPSAK